MSEDTVSTRLARIENTLLYFSAAQERFDDRSLATQQQLADITSRLTEIMARFADHVDSEKRQWTLLETLDSRVNAHDRGMEGLKQKMAGNLSKESLLYGLIAVLGGAATLVAQWWMNR